MDQVNPSPIEHIPPEILRKIFITLRNMSSEHDEVADLALAENDVIAVCTVSKQWRAVTLDTSYLWSRVVYLGPTSFGPTGSLQYFKRSCLLSGQQKLRVVIKSATAARAKFDGLLPDAPALGPIMALVMNHIHRVEILLLSFPSCSPLSLQPLLLDHPMNLLDKAFPWSGIPLTSLKSLTISDVLISIPTFQFFLRHCLQLVNLTVRRVIVMDPTTTIEPSLTDLRLLHLPCIDEAEWDVTLLFSLQRHGISMPRLSKLALHMVAPHELLSGPVLPSLPTSVKELTLKGPFSDAALCTILSPNEQELCCDLRVIRLHGCEAGDRFFASFPTWPVFPSLTLLEVLYGDSTDDDVLRFLDAHDNISSDFKSPLRVTIDCCHRTTKKLAKALRERGVGTWLTQRPDQPARDFLAFFEFTMT